MLRKEQEKAEAEKKRFAEKEVQKTKTMWWVLGGIAAIAAVLAIIAIPNRPTYINVSASDFSYVASSNPIVSFTGSSNGHDYVDLGISVKWATCNVGAAKPEDCGDIFPWGYDAAKENWGGAWRMPTEAESKGT